MLNIDWMRPGVWLVGAGMLLTFLGALIIGWHARASQSVVLACATLIGAIFFLAIQAGLELQPSRAREFIGGAFVLDPVGPAIHHVRKAMAADQMDMLLSSLKTIPEASANSRLESLKPRPNLNRNDAEGILTQIRIGTDFALFSLLHYIKIRQPDWEAKWALIEAPFLGASSVQPTASFTTRNCTDFDEQQVRSLLRDGGNLFAEASLKEFATNPLCLPPMSTMRLTKDSLRISNPFLDTTLTVRFLGGSGTLLFQIDVVTVYHALRARHPSMKDYRQWLDRLISDARPWFGASQ